MASFKKTETKKPVVKQSDYEKSVKKVHRFARLETSGIKFYIYTKKDGKFNWKSFIGDQLKLAGGFVVLDIAYLTGRPYLAKEFLESGVEPAQASLYADLISKFIIFNIIYYS